MSRRETGWAAASWLAAFVTFVAVTVFAQYVAVSAYEAWWNSTDAAGQPIPDSTFEFLKWVVGGGVGLLAGKLVGDRI